MGVTMDAWCHAEREPFWACHEDALLRELAVTREGLPLPRRIDDWLPPYPLEAETQA